MSASFDVIALEIVRGGFNTFLSVLKVLIPLMIVIEFLHVYKIMERLSQKMGFISNILGISNKGVLPLLIATIMGVTYGAGTLIEMNERDPLDRRDFLLISVFFVICHGIIETTAIWANAGANVFVISIGRLLYATIITAVFARLPYVK